MNDELRLHEMQNVCVELSNERDAFCNENETLNFAVKPFQFSTVMVRNGEYSSETPRNVLYRQSTDDS